MLKVTIRNFFYEFLPNLTPPLTQDENLVSKIDAALEISITDNWIGNKIKEKKVRKSIALIIDDEEQIDKIMDIIKKQDEYK